MHVACICPKTAVHFDCHIPSSSAFPFGSGKRMFHSMCRKVGQASRSIISPEYQQIGSVIIDFGLLPFLDDLANLFSFSRKKRHGNAIPEKNTQEYSLLEQVHRNCVEVATSPYTPFLRNCVRLAENTCSEVNP